MQWVFNSVQEFVLIRGLNNLKHLTLISFRLTMFVIICLTFI